MHDHFVPTDPGRGASIQPRTFGMLSTFPPTECGIATFAAALAAGIIATGGAVDVVRCGAAPRIEDASVVAALDDHSPRRVDRAVEVLDDTDVVIVQHEYGIYDGPDGAGVLDIVERLTAPTIVVAHTVPSRPTEQQRSILVRLCRAADSVVVMTETARQRLIEHFGISAGHITVIAHGAMTPPAGHEAEAYVAVGAPRLLTWGLLGPGKGIEWAIDAMAQLADLAPRPHYVIAGATHPKVLERSGEAYRDMLRSRAERAAVTPHLTFDATYRDLESLHVMIRSADLVVLPYDSQDQVTSGVLVDAVAAGRPVVSTAFPHAVELLSSGAGIVVPQRDPDALAAAIRTALTEPGRAAAMAAESRRLAPDLSWATVARRYAGLAEQLLASRTRLAS